MQRFTRREFIGKLSSAAALASPMLSALPARAQTRKNIRIGYLPITDATPLLIAHAQGFYADEGLTAEQPIRIRNWSTLAESFLTDKFDITHLLLPIPIWMRFKNGAPIKILAWNHTNGSALTVSAASGIKSFADLGGRQLAVPYWYSMHNIILQMGLRDAGLTPVIQQQSISLAPHEVNLFILSPPEMPAALSGDKIDGYIVAEPYNAIAERKISARIMRFTGDIWKNHPCCVVVMKEHLINSDPVFVQKAINAVVRAQLWINDHLSETARILGRDGGNYLPVSTETLNRAFLKYDQTTYGPGASPQAIRHPQWDIRRIGFQPYPYPSATEFITQQMRSTRMEGDQGFLESLNASAVAKEIIDDRFVKKSLSLYGGYSRFSEIALDHPWTREEVIDL